MLRSATARQLSWQLCLNGFARHSGSKECVCGYDQPAFHCNDDELMRFAVLFQALCGRLEQRIVTDGGKGCLEQNMSR